MQKSVCTISTNPIETNTFPPPPDTPTQITSVSTAPDQVQNIQMFWINKLHCQRGSISCRSNTFAENKMTRQWFCSHKKLPQFNSVTCVQYYNNKQEHTYTVQYKHDNINKNGLKSKLVKQACLHFVPSIDHKHLSTEGKETGHLMEVFSFFFLFFVSLKSVQECTFVC